MEKEPEKSVIKWSRPRWQSDKESGLPKSPGGGNSKESDMTERLNTQYVQLKLKQHCKPTILQYKI